MLRGSVIKPIPIASFQNKQLKFFPEAFEKALDRKDVADIPIVVFASNGPARTGKSFFLNQMIKYCKFGIKEDWLCSKLNGFEWKGDTDCVTSGLLLWPEPLIIKDPKTNNKLAILLMDNQGLGEEGTSCEDEAKLVCLSYMCSSIFTYNIKDFLSRDAFKELHRLAAVSSSILQTISGNKSNMDRPECLNEYNRSTLILRCIDIMQSNKYQVDGSQFFGPEISPTKGNCLYKMLFETDENLCDQSVTYRNTLRDSFSEILLLCSKSPGNKPPMDQEEYESGKNKLDEEFEKGLKKSVPILCSYDFLHSKTKVIGGERVTGGFLGKILGRLVRQLDKQNFNLNQITVFDLGPQAYYRQKQMEHNHLYDNLANDTLHEFGTVSEFNDSAFSRIKECWLTEDMFGAPAKELQTFLENLKLYAHERQAGLNQRICMFKATKEVQHLKNLLANEAKHREELEKTSSNDKRELLRTIQSKEKESAEELAKLNKRLTDETNIRKTLEQKEQDNSDKLKELMNEIDIKDKQISTTTNSLDGLKNELEKLKPKEKTKTEMAKENAYAVGQGAIGSLVYDFASNKGLEFVKTTGWQFVKNKLGLGTTPKPGWFS